MFQNGHEKERTQGPLPHSYSYLRCKDIILFLGLQGFSGIFYPPEQEKPTKIFAEANFPPRNAPGLAPVPPVTLPRGRGVPGCPSPAPTVDEHPMPVRYLPGHPKPRLPQTKMPCMTAGPPSSVPPQKNTPVRLRTGVSKGRATALPLVVSRGSRGKNTGLPPQTSAAFAVGKGEAAECVSRCPLGSGEGYGACDDAIPPGNLSWEARGDILLIRKGPRQPPIFVGGSGGV